MQVHSSLGAVTDGRGSGQGAVTGALHWVALFVLLAAIAYPFAHILLRGVAISHIAPEFVSYRIGDALGLMFGETERVRPVQGLPSALVSKAIVYALFPIYGRELLTPSVLQEYCIIWYLTWFAVLAAGTTLGWSKLDAQSRIAFGVFALVPWYVGGPNLTCLMSPEYWLAEYVFLALSLVALHHRLTPVAVGAWVALGVAIKIPLVGIALLFLIPFDWRRRAVAVAAGAIAYPSIVLLYAGSLPLAWQMLRFQFSFFVSPNSAPTYSGLFEALSAHPIIAAALGVAAVWTLARIARLELDGMAAGLLVFLNVYLVWRRPSFTSLVSMALAMNFLIALGISRSGWWHQPWRLRAAVISGCVAALLSGFPAVNFWTSVGSEPIPDFHGAGRAIWFMPTNSWNAALPVQMFGYHGSLGLHPATVDDKGRPAYALGGRALRYFFGDVMLVGDSEFELDLLRRAVKHKIPIYWTRPVAVDGASLRDAIEGAETELTRVYYRGVEWEFGTTLPNGATPAALSKRVVALENDEARVNTDFAFARSTPRNPLGTFFMSPDLSSGRVSLERDPEGSYLRVVATKRNQYLVINDLFYGKVNPPDGLILRAVVRGRCRGALRLTIFDVTGPEGTSDGPLQTTPCSSQWVEMEIKTSSTRFPHPGDNYSVGLSDVEPGDWFEVREFSLYRMQTAGSSSK